MDWGPKRLATLPECVQLLVAERGGRVAEPMRDHYSVKNFGDHVDTALLPQSELVVAHGSEAS